MINALPHFHNYAWYLEEPGIETKGARPKSGGLLQSAH